VRGPAGASAPGAHTGVRRCKTLVVADKQFTIHDAPAVLTVHLKRFSPLGRKLGHLVRYPDALPLAPYMSAGQFGPRYALFGVISHAGGGPHSGHYYAHVRGADGRWREANDDSVAPARDGPTGLRSAYILFYIREKGQALEAALAAPTGTPSKALAQAPATPAKAPLVPRSVGRPSIVGAMKRKPDDDGDAPAKKRQIGPRMSDGGFDADPQARALGAKIASAGTGAKKLVDYEDAQSSDTGEAVADADDAPEEESAKVPAPSAPATPAPAPLPLTMPTASFYGSGKKKAAAAEEEDEIEDADGGDAPALRNQLPMQFGGGRHQHQRRGAASPFNRVKGSNNLHAERQKNNPHRYGKTPRRRL
jgi:ubiquitin carboxyl-terminal hydrolase 36/42